MSDFTGPEHPPGLELAKLKKLPEEEVRLLWESDYYDGLLTGVAELHGTRCLLHIADIGQLGSPREVRQWVIYSLTDEQHANEERWHTLFRQHVSPTQCDHTGTLPPPLEGAPDRAAFFARYEVEYRPPRLQLSQAVGWCDGYTFGPEGSKRE